MPTTPNISAAKNQGIGGLVAVSQNSRVKPLGYLTWFSVPDESVSLRRLKSQLTLHGLPPTLAPSDTKAINVFKRAMREQDGRHRDNGLIVETDVVPVVETADECIYQISQVKRDLDENIVDYPKALRVSFNKRSEALNFASLKEAPRSAILPMMEAIEDYVEKNASRVTGAKVRGIVRNYLKSERDESRSIEGLSGENLRGKAGGIYFIPAQYVGELEAMSACLDELYGGKAYLHAIPLADGDSEREIVRRHHVANSRQELLEATGEVKQLLKADRERAVRSDVVANKWAQFRQIQRRAAKYNALLKDEQEEIEQMADVLSRQLDKLT